MSEDVRFLVMVAALICVAVFPISIDPVHRPVRVWLLVLVVEILWFGMILSVAYHLGDPKIHWYRAPLLGIADLIGLAYCLSVVGNTTNRWKR